MNDPRPPRAPHSGVLTRHDARPAEPGDTPPEVVAPAVHQPFEGAPLDPVEEHPTDPEATIDTQEISRAELRAAALRAGVAVGDVAAIEAPSQVDLVEAEREEAPAAPGVVAAGGDAPVVGEAAAIDPRIFERRAAVAEADARRRRRIMLAVIAAASAVGIVWLIIQSPFLSVQSVDVQGATRETRTAVERAAAVRDGAPLLTLDTGEVARRVEALPWVASATVDRDFPDGITITVEERLPVAWTRRPVPIGAPAGTVGAVAVVDVSGRVLGDEPQPPAGLPEIVGLPEVPERGGHIRPSATAAALHALPDALRAQTGSLELRRGQGVLRLVTPPGGAPPAAGEVRLGPLEQVEQKGASALAVLDQLARDGDEVGYVDVGVPGAPATR